MPLKDDADVTKHYQASDALTAFTRYEKMALSVSRDTIFTTIDGPQTPYNYTEFILELTSAAQQVDDGAFAFANIFDLQSQAIATTGPRRMVLVKGSHPAALIGTAAVGDQFHVLGIPRVNLDALMQTVPPMQARTVKGAYEIIIVAVME
jgi:hypothetical protein